MLHMIVYTYFYSLLYENSDACFLNFGAARTPYPMYMYDVYTKDSKHGLCFPTLKYVVAVMWGFPFLLYIYMTIFH